MQTINFDRQDMSEGERLLFENDLLSLCREYFEQPDRLTIDVTKSEEGFSICAIFSARRIKRVKKIN